MQSTIFRLGAVGLVAATLAACAPGTYPPMSADAQRAAIGVGAGAVAAKAFGEDPVKGALVGGAAGALCDDFGVCRPG
ncbi:hypothetical protein DRW48_00045 [Paracoccus suum]|uniref:YMGG-like Gly-zipper domain-containing protein n=1 Tax=Paracoccus suum TaxID=2259340 RepID=A0A344PG10_9RHOB|nr:hypothetical protein [Paracoccus suum]AXC48315.1 hypothetical protein DRW48_00045 [Paracoccus suum]